MNAIAAGQQRLDFMTLMVTELRNQNPLEPLDNQQMASQLAQFTQLELTEKMNGNLDTMNQSMTKMNTSFEGAMLMAQLDYAKSMLGQQVEFSYNVNGVNRTMDGKVNRVFVKEGDLMLEVDSKMTYPNGTQGNETFYVPLDAVEGIRL